MELRGMNSRDSWYAAMACALINLLTLLPLKLGGLLFVEILGRYNTSRAMASNAVFLSMLVRCVGGPLGGYCGESFGVNSVIMAGSILSGLGVGACFFSEEIVSVIVFLGLVYGLGLTFSNTLLAQVLKQHFDKNLTLAISMSMIGACIGGFIIPPLIKWIFQMYGVSGTFLILGGIMLNAVPVTMFLSCVKPKKGQARTKHKEGKPLVSKTTELPAFTFSKDTPNSAENENLKAVELKKEHCIWELENKSNAKMALFLSDNQTYSENLQNNSTAFSNELGTNLKYFKKDLIQDQQLKNGNDAYEQTVTLLLKSVETSPGDIKKNIPTETEAVDEKPVSRQKAALQSLTIFLDVTFWIMLVTQSYEIIVQMMVLTTMLDYSRDKGIDRSYEVHFLMCLPLAEIVGGVVLSMIIDRNYISRLNFTVISFNVLAGTVLMIAWAKTFAVMAAGVVVFGLVTSGLLSVFPMIVFQFMEPKNYTMALASRIALYGPMSLLCGPIIGYFRGTKGSYDWVYYILAILSVACAFLTIFTPHCAKRRDRKQDEKRSKEKLHSSTQA